MAAVLASASLALVFSTKTCTHFLPSPMYYLPRPYHFLLFYYSHNTWGKRWRSLLRHCAASKEVVGSIPDGIIRIFIDLILPAAIRVEPACDRNEYQEYLLGVKTTLPLSCASCLEILGCSKP